MGRDLRTLADLAGPENFTGTYSSATVVPRVDIVGTERTLANATVASLVHQLFVPRPEPVFAEWGVQANGSPPTSEKIAIIMADDRPLMSLDQVPTVNMQPEYHDLNMLSMTAVANMVYAARHGYDFKLMSLPAPRDRSPTWNKVRAIYAALAHYDLVAFIDTDSWFAQPSLSLAELMDRWRFGPAASLLLPLDPPGQPSANFNSTNTGFWLVRNTTVSRNALRALWRCPETIAECAPLKRGFPHEQGAFSRFIRPRLAEWDQLVIAPCEESNGFWRHWKCKGSVIVHPWDCKECVVPRVRDLLVREHWAVYRKMLHASHHVRCTGPDGLDACLEQEPV
ncbi:hypothetical protein BC828DRAFT_350160 [Blastocladiella britannica]|nr:hypothetical protein BC828DRAFT_350160 [Blastocladiella britannica]